jgi:Mg-chelatase subunit ChlD
MFQSFRKNKAKKSTDDSSNMDMDTTADSFIHIDQTDKPSLSLKVTPRHDTIGIDVDQKSTQFCATVTARDLPDDDESSRAPVDIVVALDVSSSMSGSKLQLCKTTLSLLLRELSSSDRFGLVTFGSDVKLEIPTRKLTKLNKDNALAKIKSLTTNGCTNMSGGIGMAAQEINSVENPHKVQTIFLLTDGQANVGISDKEGMVNLTKGCLSPNEDQSTIPIHCFGYGSDHDREMLRDISLATEGGTYYFVDDDSDVTSAFGDALGGVLSVVAQNTVVSLRVPEPSRALGVSITNVNHDKATKNSDGSFSVSLNDFYAEESRDILFEVTLSTESSAAPVDHVEASMSYLDTINSKLVQGDKSQGSIARPLGNELSPANEHVLLQCIRIQTTEVISQAEKLANNGELSKAKTVISSHIAHLQKESDSLANKSDPFVTQMLTELNTMLAGLTSQIVYEANGAKYMQSRLMNHKAQRASESSDVTFSAYRSSAKYARAKKMKTAFLQSVKKP